ncbi:hypothetical protein MSPP1_000430 [Malassezia sp. CBS 17886]|nr:hypothetical protein MSPP1_000430 [Malassezia sp. CBS 17886]
MVQARTARDLDDVDLSVQVPDISALDQSKVATQFVDPCKAAALHRRCKQEFMRQRRERNVQGGAWFGRQ